MFTSLSFTEPLTFDVQTIKEKGNHYITASGRDVVLYFDGFDAKNAALARAIGLSMIAAADEVDRRLASVPGEPLAAVVEEVL